jgi:hypothetical protein
MIAPAALQCHRGETQRDPGKGARVMAKNTRLAALLQLNEQLRAWLDAPHQRALREQVRRLVESPRWHELQEQVRRLNESPQAQELQRFTRWLEQQQHPAPSAPKPQPDPPPKKTGGRKRVLAADEIERLQAAYADAYRDNPKRKQSDVFNDLRKLLGRKVSDTTLRDRIVRPLARK